RLERAARAPAPDQAGKPRAFDQLNQWVKGGKLRYCIRFSHALIWPRHNYSPPAKAGLSGKPERFPVFLALPTEGNTESGWENFHVASGWRRSDEPLFRCHASEWAMVEPGRGLRRAAHGCAAAASPPWVSADGL